MANLVDSLGIDPSSNLQVFLLLAGFTFAVVTVLWLVGLRQGNHSMMDGWYGFAFFVPALFAYLIVDTRSIVAVLLLFMVGLHGCRLGWYLARRWAGYRKTFGGDPRYLRFAEEMKAHYWIRSFFKVMEPQAVIIVLIGSPAVWGILTSRHSDGPLTPLAFLGLVVFSIGLYFETLADGQLQAFLADKPHNQGRYLNTGVWTHSRHPNYFGNTTVWWGIWIVAVAGAPSIWWTVVGPLINTIMLTSVLGSKFQDRHMGGRPEYQKLMARTRAFLPLPVARRTATEPSESPATPAESR